MPWKVVGNCVHKLDADGSVGKVVPGGCHQTPAQAQAHKRALYANVKEMQKMSKRDRIKEKDRRERRRLLDLQKEAEAQALEDLEDEDELDAGQEAAVLAEELDELETLDELDEDEQEESEQVQKEYDGESVSAMPMMGPTSFDELDNLHATEEKAAEVRKLTWNVEDLVYNILRNPMMKSEEKASAISKVGADFGTRVDGIMNEPAEDMSKEVDLELLEAEVLLAKESRNLSTMDRVVDFLTKAKLSYAAKKGMPDSAYAYVTTYQGKKIRKYLIHDAAHVRNALSRAAQQIKRGVAPFAGWARAALPKIKAAAKKFGIGANMKKSSAIMIQKDANGDWRWIGWPSNNFKDRSDDILTEAAHREYVEWWNKEKPKFPVFTSMHAPGTARTYPVDFVGYRNGFLTMSGKLTEEEAVHLLEVQKEYDLGMSHTGWGVRDSQDPRQIKMYRIFEVTDLPLEMADNLFTDGLSIVTKEADIMNDTEQLEYLTKITGNPELAKQALEEKTKAKQAALQQAGVEQKEAKTETTPVTTPAPELEAILKAVGDQLDLDGLNAFVQQAQESIGKVEALESLVKEQQKEITKLKGDTEEQLAEKLTPPAAGRFAWSKERPSQSEKTVVEGEDKEALQKGQAGIPDNDEYWLSQATSTAPVPAQAET